MPRRPRCLTGVGGRLGRRTIRVFYDVGKPFEFFAEYELDELQNSGIPDFIQRHSRALKRQEEAATELFSRDERQSFFNGRPDFIVVVKRGTDGAHEVLERVLIGETKYTQSLSTLLTGLRELLEYLFLVQENGEWLFQEGIQETDMKGILCSDGVVTSSDEWRYIEHWCTEDIQEYYFAIDDDS